MCFCEIDTRTSAVAAAAFLSHIGPFNAITWKPQEAEKTSCRVPDAENPVYSKHRSYDSHQPQPHAQISKQLPYEERQACEEKDNTSNCAGGTATPDTLSGNKGIVAEANECSNWTVKQNDSFICVFFPNVHSPKGAARGRLGPPRSPPLIRKCEVCGGLVEYL